MPRSFTAANSDKIIAGGTSVPSATDFTCLAVIKPSSLSADNRIIGASTNVGSSVGWQLRLSSGELRLVKQGVTDIASGLTPLSTGSVYAVAAKCQVSSGVTFYQKQAAGSLSKATTANASAINSGSNAVLIGHRGNSSPDLFFDGVIANCFIASGLLADGLVEHLMNMALSGHWGALSGASPVFLMPLLGFASPEPDYSGQKNNSTTITGTAYAPLFTGQMFSNYGGWHGAFTAAAGGGVTVVPSLMMMGVGF